MEYKGLRVVRLIMEKEEEESSEPSDDGEWGLGSRFWELDLRKENRSWRGREEKWPP